MSTPSVWDLVDELKKDGVQRQVAALKSLAERGADARGAVPTIIPLLRDDNRDVKEAALETLGAIGPAALSAAPVMVEMTRGENGSDYLGIRVAAGTALGNVTRGQRSAIPILIEAIQTGCYWAQANAADVLGEFGAEAAAAVPALADALRSPAWIVSTNLVRVLGQLGAAARDALPVLEDRMNRGDPEMRKQAKLAREAILDACVV